ncbi:MAG: hypothetical protein RSA97_07430 [Oscillospiraceae bacterium]
MCAEFAGQSCAALHRVREGAESAKILLLLSSGHTDIGKYAKSLRTVWTIFAQGQ